MKTTFSCLLIGFMLFVATGCGMNDKAVSRDDAMPSEQKVSINMEKSEYILGVGDEIDFSVYKQQEVTAREKINTSGIIIFPKIGDVMVKGKGMLTLRDELTEKYKQYFVNPQVIIRLTHAESQKFMVTGEVKQPGLFLLDARFSVSEAIAKAGGITPDGQDGVVLLIRRGRDGNEVKKVEIGGDYAQLDLSKDLSVSNGDIVYVPQKGLSVSARFMDYIGRIVSPMVTLESGTVLFPQVKNVLHGTTTTNNNVLIGK